MEKRNYELMFIVNPERDEEDLDNVLQRVQRFLEAADAQVFSFKSWGLRRLAYTIAGQREGRYYLVHFAADPGAITEFERSLRLVDDVLRHLVTRLEGVPVSEAEASEEETPEAVSSEVAEETTEA